MLNILHEGPKLFYQISWSFIISDKNDKIYYKNTDGKEIINRIDDNIKKSLQKLGSIFDGIVESSQ